METLDKQRDFTNQLRHELKGNFPDNPNKPIGFYEKKDLKTLLQIKSTFLEKIYKELLFISNNLREFEKICVF